ncbi:PucR family transcriptional regulator ligand-binding domain-containing protein [Paenibacillus sp. VCA1]|uniref:PucR family transcriptional regulator n=1 Tax=Paenibacillus sp. VCA1 TaxID=3039148 RepID=UPI002872593F|nr:PucR family transcriptional regulator ligand-binding domain-containing protein [Paenibacillus sp. VCA1]MDR9853252.1 PucR family transcriptional regulator ligand-binding domain-containing protein [Paenibacillus sp. VCA1]
MNLRGLTVREMLNLPVMKNAKLISGEQGLDRIVQYIDIWEVPDIGSWLREGEMVLTAGYPARDNPSLLTEMIEQLANVNGAGIAIKPERFISQIPQEMIEKSNLYHIPVIQLPLSAAYIDITYNVMEQILNRQAVLLKRSEEVNKALTGLVLNNKGIQVVADSVSKLIDSSIWIVDKGGAVLASSPEGNPYVPSGNHRQWEVNVDNKMLGKFVVEKRELDELDLMLIEQARLVFSLELMREKIAYDTESRLRGTFFEELILNPPADERITASKGLQLGLSPDWLWEVAVIEADEPFYNEDAPIAEAIQSYLSEESAARKVRPQLQIHGGKIVLFLPSVPTADTEKRPDNKRRPLPWGEELQRWLKPWDTVRVGMGRQAPLFEANRSYNEARTAVSIGFRLNQRRQLFTYAEVEMLQMLLNSSDSAWLGRFVDERIGKLAEHDQANGTNYVSTLYHYLATGGSLNETSNRMFIHRNSVNYRIDRIKSMTGLDLNSAQSRFELYLCSAYQLLKRA